MSDQQRDDNLDSHEDETVRRLLRLAGPRPDVPADIAKRVYERVANAWESEAGGSGGDRVYGHVHREWRRTSGGTARFMHWAIPIAASAATLVVAVIVMQPKPAPVASVPIGTVTALVGDHAGAERAIGDRVHVGDRLVSGDGGIGIELRNGESLRLDANTTLVALTDDHFRLVNGRIYADTGDFSYRPRVLSIETAFGSVTDVGTQFVVGLAADSLDVAVREGRVNVDDGGQSLVAVAGERLTIARIGGPSVDSLQAHDPYWDWAMLLAAPFNTENKSLLDFLRWAARETGRDLQFASDELRMAAMRVDLHGSLSGFTPLEALDSVMAGTRFRYRVEADRIVIDE